MSEWLSDPLGKIFIYSVACGVICSLLGVALAHFGKNEQHSRYEIAAAIGFVVGASMGALFGIFGIMADRL